MRHDLLVVSRGTALDLGDLGLRLVHVGVVFTVLSVGQLHLLLEGQTAAGPRVTVLQLKANNSQCLLLHESLAQLRIV